MAAVITKFLSRSQSRSLTNYPVSLNHHALTTLLTHDPFASHTTTPILLIGSQWSKKYT